MLQIISKSEVSSEIPEFSGLDSILLFPWMMEGRISRPDLAHGPRIVKLGALTQVECH